MTTKTLLNNGKLFATVILYDVFIFFFLNKKFHDIVVYVMKQFLRKSNQNISNAYIMNKKEKFSIIVKEYEFIRTDINRRNYISIKCARDCFNQYFHTFSLRCLHNNEITNGDFVNGKIRGKKLKQIVHEKSFVNELTINI